MQALATLINIGCSTTSRRGVNLDRCSQAPQVQSTFSLVEKIECSSLSATRLLTTPTVINGKFTRTCNKLVREVEQASHLPTLNKPLAFWLLGFLLPGIRHSLHAQDPANVSGVAFSIHQICSRRRISCAFGPFPPLLEIPAFARKDLQMTIVVVIPAAPMPLSPVIIPFMREIHQLLTRV